MANGLSSPDSVIGIRPQEIKAPESHFTPLPESNRSTTNEPPKYGEQSMAIPPGMPPELKKVMEQIQAEAVKGKEQAEVLPQVKTEKPQGFWANIWEAIKNFFRNLFR